MSPVITNKVVKTNRQAKKRTACKIVGCGTLIPTEECDMETSANKRNTVDRMNLLWMALWISLPPAGVINPSHLN